MDGSTLGPDRYYKGVDLDGTDTAEKSDEPDYFEVDRRRGRAPAINYADALASGAVIRHPAHKTDAKNPTTYITVATTPMDCRYPLTWPYRLFEVEPVGDVHRVPWDKWPRQWRVSALRVVAELPAHAALGPHGVEVEALIGRVGQLTQAQVLVLASFYEEPDTTSPALSTDESPEALDRAGFTATDAVWEATHDAASHGWNTVWEASPDEAWNAKIVVSRAVGSLVHRDVLTPAEFDAGYGAWATIVGGQTGDSAS